MIKAALSGQLDSVSYQRHPIFNIEMPTSCPGVPAEVLDPRGTWADKAAYDHATKGELKPVKLTNTLAFMFETRFPQHVTRFAADLETLQEDYADCWTPLDKNFTGEK